MKLKSIILAGVALVLAGCTTMKGGDSAVEIKSSKEVQLTNVSVKHNKGQIDVSGTLRPTSSAVRRVGHVDVEFIGLNGEVIEHVKAEQHLRKFSHSSSRRPTFSATVKLNSAQIKIVRLTHHVDTRQECEL